ncbi:Uncharacterised protein [uncultured archaeon]|nr:Uncharacterised protein [uncultured archaeon]
MDAKYQKLTKLLEKNDYEVSSSRHILDSGKMVLGEVSLDGVPKISYHSDAEHLAKQVRLRRLFLDSGIKISEENVSEAIENIRVKKTLIEQILGELEK